MKSGCASCTDSSFRIRGCNPSGPADLAMFSFERSPSISSSVKVTSCEGCITRICSTLGSSESSSSVKTFLKKELRTSALATSVSVSVPSSRSRLGTPCRTFSFDFFVSLELFRILFDLAGNILLVQPHCFATCAPCLIPCPRVA